MVAYADNLSQRVQDMAKNMSPAQPTQLESGVLANQVTMQADPSRMRHAAQTPRGEQANMTRCMQMSLYMKVPNSHMLSVEIAGQNR